MSRKTDRKEELSVANRYFKGEDALRVTGRLKDFESAHGLLLAGHILLDWATRVEPPKVSRCIQASRRSFRRTLDSTGYLDADVRLRARALLAQLPLLSSIYGRQQMPSRQRIMISHRNLTLAALSAMDSMPSPGDALLPPDEVYAATTDVWGALGEISVLLLNQRAAARGAQVERLALKSLLSHDHGGNCLGTTGLRAWDISFYEQQPGQPPMITHGMEVKRSLSWRRAGPALYLLPGLALGKHDNWIPERIAADCESEYYAGYSLDSRPTQALNARTQLLLPAIEQAGLQPGDLEALAAFGPAA